MFLGNAASISANQMAALQAEHDAALARAEQAAAAPCTWTEYETEGLWHTACGTEWYFSSEDASPAAYGYKFCQSCGHPIAFVPYVDADGTRSENSEPEAAP